MIAVIIVLYLTSYSCQTSLKEYLYYVLLIAYLSTNSMISSFQSAYIKHDSTETTFLSVHDRNYYRT